MIFFTFVTFIPNIAQWKILRNWWSALRNTRIESLLNILIVYPEVIIIIANIQIIFDLSFSIIVIKEENGRFNKILESVGVSEEKYKDYYIWADPLTKLTWWNWSERQIIGPIYLGTRLNLLSATKVNVFSFDFFENNEIRITKIPKWYSSYR